MSATTDPNGGLRPPPTAPWTLYGSTTQAVSLLDVEVARALVPRGLTVVPVFPGKTLSGVFIASYGAGSTLSYNELLIVPAFVRYGSRYGFFISHIYVDHEVSLRGGRDIWGLPKHLASFERFSDEVERSADIAVDGELICRMHVRRGWIRWPQVMRFSMLSVKDSLVLQTACRVTGRLHFASGVIAPAVSAPFAALRGATLIATTELDHARFAIKSPKAIGRLG
jgi:acetoacetate decarboxylase